MRILGIDPGLDITGYGVIEEASGNPAVLEAGVIRTSHKRPLKDRLNSIYSQLTDLIKTTKPNVSVVEKLYSHYKHPMTAILMGHARGVILLCCNQNNVDVIDYPAKTAKRAITGNGNASKVQVQLVVNKVLNLKEQDRPLDVTDALALSLTYIYHTKRPSLLKKIARDDFCVQKAEAYER